jgi:eukaryotic-like serine/threonine-protein kinase
MPRDTPPPRPRAGQPSASLRHSSPVQSRARDAAPRVVPAAVQGTVQLAISPWGEVEVNGTPAGTTPPLTRLALPEGTHTLTVRNADAPPYSTTVQVRADTPVTVRHRFGP